MKRRAKESLVGRVLASWALLVLGIGVAVFGVLQSAAILPWVLSAGLLICAVALGVLVAPINLWLRQAESAVSDSTTEHLSELREVQERSQVVEQTLGERNAALIRELDAVTVEVAQNRRALADLRLDNANLRSRVKELEAEMKDPISAGLAVDSSPEPVKPLIEAAGEPIFRLAIPPLPESVKEQL